jgi:hypothetical protein
MGYGRDLGERSMSGVTATKVLRMDSERRRAVMYYNERDRHASGRRTMAV